MVTFSKSNARTVGVAGTALVASSIAGGIVSVLAEVNTWANAWTAEATLAAPWPMLVLQAAATVAAVQRRRVFAAAGATVLALSAAVAGISGFFDGQLAREDLGAGYVAMQIVFVVVAWATVAIAAVRLWKLLRSGSGRRQPRPAVIGR